ncbi:hypothetical protein PUG42_25890, partial [Erwiniaceae bacterium L1_54_3]|nr:hypothetical protein [Erwiniaceae bacterium L1_54_3]
EEALNGSSGLFYVCSQGLLRLKFSQSRNNLPAYRPVFSQFSIKSATKTSPLRLTDRVNYRQINQ